jgi:hypothetical protein
MRSSGSFQSTNQFQNSRMSGAQLGTPTQQTHSSRQSFKPTIGAKSDNILAGDEAVNSSTMANKKNSAKLNAHGNKKVTATVIQSK